MKKSIFTATAMIALMSLSQVALSGGGTETIKVSKCYSTGGVTYCQLLLKASSSNASAHLYAYLPDGTSLGEIQNGGGSRYGGDVRQTYSAPAYIVFVSSTGATTTAPTTPFQL